MMIRGIVADISGIDANCTQIGIFVGLPFAFFFTRGKTRPIKIHENRCSRTARICGQILMMYTSSDVFPRNEVRFRGRVDTAPNIGVKYQKTILGREYAFQT